MTEAERHEHQHNLITERWEAYANAPRRSGRERIKRRERGKTAWWTLTGHLRAMHDVGGQSPFLSKTYEEIAAWHDRLHDGTA